MNLSNVDCNSAFILYADCSVIYDGRARSTLERGRYLIIHKSDGALLIHNGAANQPVNYQGSKAKLSVDGDLLISVRKKERLEICVHEVINHTSLTSWSMSEIVIRDTEHDLVKKIEQNWNDVIKIPVGRIEREFSTQYGPIDLAGISDDGTHVIVEVKRGKASLSHCSQLNRYNEHFTMKHIKCVCILASPQIGKNAHNYLRSHGYTWISVDFDRST